MSEIITKLPTKEDFAEQVNSVFSARLDDVEQVFDFTLLKMKPMISNAIQESFSLVFLAPFDVPPLQNLFNLQHKALGSMNLLLVPFKQEEDGLYFEAVFNNLVS